jgi:hypothetical protein
MRKTYSPQPQDATKSRAEAARAGKDDARRGYPRASSSGEPVTDYFGKAATASAETAAVLHLAGHFDETRPGLDRAIAEVTALVVRLTARVGDALTRTSAADHQVHAFNQLPLAARREPWPAWLRLVLLGLMALGSGAALSGALLELTSDEPYYIWGFCLAATLAVVALGAFLAHTARSFESNRLKPDQFTTGWLPKILLGIGALFAVCLMVALASIRGTAAEADAGRQSRADDGVTLLLPDQPVDASGPARAEEQKALPSVSPLAFGLLEGLLFMAAFGVEYINYLPWADQRRKAERSLAAAESELRDGTEQLGHACGRLMAGLDDRADRDAAALLAGEATVTHATAEISDYRRAVLAHQPNLGGDPFQGAGCGGEVALRSGAAVSSGDQVSAEVVSRWGRDLLPAGLIRPDATYDHLEVHQLAATALARGLAVLSRVPERASFAGLAWSPVAFIDDALRLAETPASSPIGVKVSGNNGVEPRAKP